MFLSRYFGTALFSAAKTGTSPAAATQMVHNPLEQFFEVDRRRMMTSLLSMLLLVGRSWKAFELRLKSWDDIQKLWHDLLREKNMLMTQRQMLQAQNMQFPNPERIPKVRKSMCRVKQVLTERAIVEPDTRRSAEMKGMINAL